MRKEHMLSLQPLLMSENPVFKIERPRTFYSPPEKKFSIQSRYFLNLDVRNVTKAAAVFVDAEAKLLVDTLDKKKSERATTARTNILASEEKACIHFMFVDDVSPPAVIGYQTATHGKTDRRKKEFRPVASKFKTSA